ncbi:MAG: 16S rRNA (uracil(1498)-N(3))-methyltransferase [Alphaproteobacteria bacterium]|nr:16S rRNA (uracil(1498)-N(3))-methyltransferase [Alphaproteobacteria bacterium]
MGKIRVYSDKNLRTSSLLRIENDDFHYIKNVMRLKKNEHFIIFNGTDGEFNCNIIELNKKDLKIQIEEKLRSASDENLNDTELIFTPIRHQRQDFLIEKATELGIKTLSPILTKNTAIKDINIERADTIAKEATEQSRRLSKPKINNITPFAEKIAKFDWENRTLIYLDERQIVNQNTVDILKKFKDKPVSFLIGPEGGFDETEFEILSKTPAVGITLGNLILRAETAGISIISLYNIGIR